MEATLEDQHSQHAQEENFNAYRSMRDHMHPPHMSAPLCIVPPIEQLVIRPHIVPLLPTFHGMESENPYVHIKEFEEVCNTFQEGGASIDLMRLKLFPFTLKDKAKERYMEAINACPHHGFDTWLLVSYFYDGMSSSMKQLLEMMCGGDFMSKNPKEAMDFLSYVAEVSRGWDESNAREVGRMKSQPNALNAKVGMYTLNEVIDMKAKVAAMARRLEELEMKKIQKVQAIYETPVQVMPCSICQSFEHLVEECPTIPVVREMFGDQENVIGQFKPNNNASYGNTYNSNWRNHPNFSWKPRAPQYTQPGQAPSQASNLEQAIVNLSKVMGDFVGDQKSINAQLSQRIDSVESTLNKRMDGMQNDLSQKIDNLQYSILRLTNLNTVQAKGKFPSQPQKNPKGIHEVEAREGESSQHEPESEAEKEKREEIKGKRKGNSAKNEDLESTMNEKPERTINQEEMMKKHTLPPFSQALHGKKGINNALEILEVLRQVKVNILLLDMIKQVLTYAKFLKDLCTIKIGLNVNKKAFFTELVNAIIQCKSPVKYKDPGYPTISVMIGGMCVEKALLDLGASVNLLSYFVYKQLGLGELKPTSITLSLVDRSVKIPRGMIEDVLVQVDKFYYLVDFVVLDTDPVAKGTNYVPIILGRPFLATSNVIINCRNGVMQLTFGNMTLELNIFYLCKKQLHPKEEEGSEEEDCLLEVLRRCKKAIGWKISNLKGISPLVCTHHIYMEEEAKPVHQPQRRLNPHMQEVVRAEVLKLFQDGIIYPISDSPWVSPMQVMPKKSGIIVVQNDKGEERLQRDGMLPCKVVITSTHALPRVPRGFPNGEGSPISQHSRII
ncbi:hypothetical protein CK203_065856 [Vitis vinifera]|uniref:Retrotransposon gag domain-containing protein n=1 Tax=Vitis vinifera TaxID=29760 RepID=A0A438FXS3_VITVI|nr:hypothetical protein CK203_065856 [Vitis vinifera]